MNRETTQAGALTKADLDAVRDRESIGTLFSHLAGSAWVALDQLQNMIGNGDGEGAVGVAALVAQMGALADRCADIFGQPGVHASTEAWIFSPLALEKLDALRGLSKADGGEA